MKATYYIKIIFLVCFLFSCSIQKGKDELQSCIKIVMNQSTEKYYRDKGFDSYGDLIKVIAGKKGEIKWLSDNKFDSTKVDSSIQVVIIRNDNYKYPQIEFTFSINKTTEYAMIESITANGEYSLWNFDEFILYVKDPEDFMLYEKAIKDSTRIADSIAQVKRLFLLMEKLNGN